jgi:hypothetical protein
MLSIVAKSQEELEVVWSNEDNGGVNTKFTICWKDGIGIEECRTKGFSSSKPKFIIQNLEPATKYTITVARKYGDRLGNKRQKVAITRSG